MNTGYNEIKSFAGYIQACKEARIIEKGTAEEQVFLRNLYHKASKLVGKEWCEFSSNETTDKGIEKSARLMTRYRILLSDIRNRGKDKNGKEKITTNNRS